jgi:malate dehydrogenase
VKRRQGTPAKKNNERKNSAMKVTIVGGAGCVGSCAAYRLAQDECVSEIVLVDSRSNVAQAHALDLDQAMVHRTRTQVRAGETGDTKDSDVIIVAVGLSNRPLFASRALNLEQSLKLMIDLVGPLSAQSPGAFWIIVTNPVDALVHLVHRTFSIAREKVIGLNRNDTCRLRWAVAKVLSVHATDVEAFVLGEHGDSQVHLLSRVYVRGEKVPLDAQQREQVRNKIVGFLPQWNQLQSGRTAGWTSAESIGDILGSMASGDGRIWACSTPLEGEYGLRDVSLGVPVKMGPKGVKEIIEFDLEPAERTGLEKSARTIQEQIKRGEALLIESAGALNELVRSMKART